MPNNTWIIVHFICVVAYANGHRSSWKTGKLITVHMSAVVVSLVLETFFFSYDSRPEIIHSRGPETKQHIITFNGPKAISPLIIHPLFVSWYRLSSI